MNRKLLARLGLVALASVAGATAHAASIISTTETFVPTTAVITFDGHDNLLAPSADLDHAGGVQVSSLVDMVIGADQQDLGQNGLWGARVEATPTGQGNFLATFATTTITFGDHGGQAQVGAFFNQYQDTDPSNNAITLTAYGAANNVLESFSYTIDTAGDLYNEGTYLGFSRGSADIYKIEVSGGTIAMDNLGLSTSPVPEPASLLLLGTGLATLRAGRRRKA